MDANSGEPWSEMDIADLTYSLAIGNSFADVASMLCRDIAEVRKKARSLAWSSARGAWSLEPPPIPRSPAR